MIQSRESVYITDFVNNYELYKISNQLYCTNNNADNAYQINDMEMDGHWIHFTFGILTMAELATLIKNKKDHINHLYNKFKTYL